MGARASFALFDTSMTLDSLKLLDGRENPKLKRFLEWRLATEIHSASEAIGHDPVMEPVPLPGLVPNWKNTVRDARLYVADHHLDDSQFLKTGLNLQPSKDLEGIDSWLQTQADGSKAQH
jgi:hypothetical protein